jgi:hypothetical protein
MPMTTNHDVNFLYSSTKKLMARRPIQACILNQPNSGSKCQERETALSLRCTRRNSTREIPQSILSMKSGSDISYRTHLQILR